MKLFLKKPGSSQALVQKVLQAATAENDNPDIRDRAYVYWRLLSSDPEVAKVIRRKDMGELLANQMTEHCTITEAHHYNNHD